MKINKLLTKQNFTPNGDTKRIQYIVIHYVGATGDAKANCEYYASKYVGASAHYFVGFKGDVWKSVEDKDIAWHCGASSYKHPECRNANAIGIEMCVHKKNTKSMSGEDKDWYFEDATVSKATELTKMLMKKYNVPIKNVIRHYDVTGKTCPNPYVYNYTKHTWDKFKSALKDEKVKIKTKCKLYKSNTKVKGAYATLVKGTSVTYILDANDGWSKISYGKNMGFVKNSCLDKSGLSKYREGTVIEKAAFRKANSVDSAKIDILKAGTKVIVVSTGKSWANCKVGKKDGFVSLKKMSI